MTLKEMMKKVLGMIEELNPDSELLTDDPDISTKIKGVVNQVMYELARFKKFPKYVEMAVTQGQTIEFADIEKKCGYEIYQIDKVCGVEFISKAGGTVLKFLESGTAEIEVFVYPERIDDKTPMSYEFELSADVLEIMPYGIAGDLLKSDVSTEYGRIYSERFESMLSRLDSRYQMGCVSFEGGFDL